MTKLLEQPTPTYLADVGNSSLDLTKTVETSKGENIKLCECGCGLRTENSKKFPYLPNRFIDGHQNRAENNSNYGKYRENSSGWKCDNVRYGAIHWRIRRILPKSDKCPICDRDIKLELCNIRPDPNPETYNMNITNWYYSCRGCQMITDGRLVHMWDSQKNRFLKEME